MKRYEAKRSVTGALVSYAKMGEAIGCSDPFELCRRIEGAFGKDTETALDVWAVSQCIMVLKLLEREETLLALREIYFLPAYSNSRYVPKRSDVSSRVLRFAYEHHMDERTVYRHLRYARLLWMKIRGIEQ